MAILSFTLLTLIGLLPSALGSLAAAERRIAEARIVRSIATEFEIKSWSQLQQAGAKEIRYFDANGVKADAGDIETSYAAQVEVTAPGTLLDEPSPNSMLRLHIAITDTPQNIATLGNAKALANRDFSIILVCHEDNRELR